MYTQGEVQFLRRMTSFCHILTVKGWTCALSEGYFEEKPSFFDKPVPKSNSLCLAWNIQHGDECTTLHTLSERFFQIADPHWEGAIFSLSRNTTTKSKKFCSDFHFLVTGYLLCMEMMSSCLQLLSFFPRLDTIITWYWQIIVHRYRNKNHTFREKISSLNSIATLKHILYWVITVLLY